MDNTDLLNLKLTKKNKNKNYYLKNYKPSK